MEITEKTPGDGKCFSKEQLMASSRYMARRDLLDALLDDNKEYSINETETIIERFMKGKVE
ncbi:MAG: hypothetical protein K2K35_02045 [Lachnospiraceae bacterium]|nr:hypothetical protein [Lachnospiraceae bacterium]